MYTRHDVVRPNRNDFLGIHYLWRKFSERDKKRKDHFFSWVNDLPNQIQFVDGRSYLYYPNSKGKLLKVEFQKLKSGVTFKHVMSDGKREGNLEFLTQDEKLIQLGKYFQKKYHQMCKSTIKMDLFIKFLKQMETNLKNQYTEKLDDEKRVISVKVGNHKYWVKAQRRNDNWVEYEFLGEVKEYFIEMS